MVFGRLTVIGFGGRERAQNGDSVRLWACRCDCGNETTLPTVSLTTGNTRSCGCLVREGTHRTHNLSKKSPAYATWVTMKTRVKNNAAYAGITICERWMKFENFYADMGERPPGMSLDRIDVRGNYEPSNCRWADRQTQNRNKTNSISADVVRRIKELTAAGFGSPYISKELGVSTSTVWRIASGRSLRS